MIKVIFTGYLGEDPKAFGEEGKLVRFSVGAKAFKRTEWMRVKVLGNQAQSCLNNLKKGDMVLVSGELQTEEYKDKEGNIKKTTDTLVGFGGEVEFLRTSGGGKKSAAPADNPDVPF